MRDGPDPAVLAGAFIMRTHVSSWLGTTLLAADVPVLSGMVSVDGSRQVPESATLTVPRFASDGASMRDWFPDLPTHPLARYGQWLDIGVEVRSTLTQDSWVVGLGRFPIQGWDLLDSEDQVRVECSGMLQRVLDARFRRPEVPRSDGTLGSEFARLMVDGIPVEISTDLSDRAVPQSFQWDEDRLGALYDIADAWPARVRVDEHGTCRVLPPLDPIPSPVLTLKDGDRGTVITAPTSDTRDGIPNVIVFRGSATDDPARTPITAVARISEGPLAPDSYGEVVEYYSSPLVTTLLQAQKAAATRLANATRPARQRVVSCVPDPRIELDDPVRVIRGDAHDLGYVVGYDLSLMGDAMTVRVGVA